MFVKCFYQVSIGLIEKEAAVAILTFKGLRCFL